MHRIYKKCVDSDLIWIRKLMDLCVAAYACISNFEIKKNKDKKYLVKVLQTLTTYRPVVTIFCNVGLNNNILI